MGIKENIAEISAHADENKKEVIDYDSTPNNQIPEEDDQDSTVVILAVRTGKLAIVAIIVSALCLIAVAGCIIYKKSKKETK